MTMKTQIKCSLIAAALLGTGGGLLALVNARAATVPAQPFLPVLTTNCPATPPPAPIVTAPAILPAADNPGVLDQRRRRTQPLPDHAVRVAAIQRLTELPEP